MWSERWLLQPHLHLENRAEEIARLASQPKAKHLAPKPFCDGNLNVPFAIAPACKARSSLPRNLCSLQTTYLLFLTSRALEK